jgi:hypothetical protein
MSRVVVGERAVVRARFVPDRDVAFGPAPAHGEVRVLDVVLQVAEQRVALVAVHADDLVHEPPRHEQRASTGDRMRAHQGMFDRWELHGDPIRDLAPHRAGEPFVEVGARRVAHRQLAAELLHHW